MTTSNNSVNIGLGLLVSNIAVGTSNDEIFILFSKYGKVAEVTLKGVRCIVKMEKRNEGLQIITELNGFHLNGQAIAITEILEPSHISGSVSERANDKRTNSLQELHHIGQQLEKLDELKMFNEPPIAMPNSRGISPPLQHFVNSEPASLCTSPSITARRESQATPESSCCGQCGAAYDECHHVPKMLSCGHTFCGDCLVSVASSTAVVCPRGCLYDTNLTESGVSGLTTDRRVFSICNYMSLSRNAEENHNGSLFSSSLSPVSSGTNQEFICSQCLTLATRMCHNEGHTVVPSEQARQVLSNKLVGFLDQHIRDLRSTMAMRAAMKERYDCTLECLQKFSEELRTKIENEDFEEAMMQDLLSELNLSRTSVLENNGALHLITLGHEINKFHESVQHQFVQCIEATTINDSTEEVVVMLKRTEATRQYFGSAGRVSFQLPLTLEDYVANGNNANVLLLYLLSDLLAYHKKQLDMTGNHFNTTSPNENANFSPHINEINMPDNITCILKTTEAIESGTSLAFPAAFVSISNVLDTDDSPKRSQPLQAAAMNPVSYLDAVKKIPLPSVEKVKSKAVVKTTPFVTVKPSGKFPHCWMKLSVNGIDFGRIIFELRPDKAPRMCSNFLGLCSGKMEYGYKGTKFFRAGEAYLLGGDTEKDDGSGGFSIYERQPFEADLCPLQDDIGMVRMKGLSTNENNRGLVASQFMIWCHKREFKKFTHSLVFGRVVDGLEVAQKAAAINAYKNEIRVSDCGVLL